MPHILSFFLFLFFFLLLIFSSWSFKSFISRTLLNFHPLGFCYLISLNAFKRMVNASTSISKLSWKKEHTTVISKLILQPYKIWFLQKNMKIILDNLGSNFIWQMWDSILSNKKMWKTVLPSYEKHIHMI